MRFIAEKHPRGEYIHLNRLLSFRAQIFAVIGAKGYGKTYRCKRYAVKRFIYQRQQMTIIRDTEAALQKLKASDGESFFNDIMRAEPLCRHEAKFDGDAIIIDGEHAGQVMALSSFAKYKGNAYSLGTILFDEFIPERTQIRRGDPAYQFLITCDTFIRDNPRTRVLLTANSLDIGSPILELLGVRIKDKQYGYYYNPEKRAVVYYAPNSPEFTQRRANSLAFTLARGTQYEGSVSENAFGGSIARIYTKREQCDLYGIYYTHDGDCFRLYKAQGKSLYYVTKDPNPNSNLYMRYTFDLGQVGVNRQYAPKGEQDKLRKLFLSGKIEFESNYILSRFLTVIE